MDVFARRETIACCCFHIALSTVFCCSFVGVKFPVFVSPVTSEYSFYSIFFRGGGGGERGATIIVELGGLFCRLVFFYFPRVFEAVLRLVTFYFFTNPAFFFQDSRFLFLFVKKPRCRCPFQHEFWDLKKEHLLGTG